eukprot:3714771-Pleurochrysis_carterae.AAC.1
MSVCSLALALIRRSHIAERQAFVKMTNNLENMLSSSMKQEKAIKLAWTCFAVVIPASVNKTFTED